MSNNDLAPKMIALIHQHSAVDAIYLYGSRAKGIAREDSDWDIGVLFQTYLNDVLEAHARPQALEAMLQKQLKHYDKISVVDVELVQPALQYNIICGDVWYDKNVPHVKRFENAVISKIEKDYRYGT
ncbi:MAG: hypothetical protein DHS20C10_12790 [marine bacterium B5-7]|nr:MAG: hypothetical protein DHS20C10_12790 [marine bacterium B5-7]